RGTDLTADLVRHLHVIRISMRSLTRIFLGLLLVLPFSSQAMFGQWMTCAALLHGAIAQREQHNQNLFAQRARLLQLMEDQVSHLDQDRQIYLQDVYRTEQAPIFATALDLLSSKLRIRERAWARLSNRRMLNQWELIALAMQARTGTRAEKILTV